MTGVTRVCVKDVKVTGRWRGRELLCGMEISFSYREKRWKRRVDWNPDPDDHRHGHRRLGQIEQTTEPETKWSATDWGVTGTARWTATCLAGSKGHLCQWTLYFNKLICCPRFELSWLQWSLMGFYTFHSGAFCFLFQNFQERKSLEWWSHIWMTLRIFIHTRIHSSKHLTVSFQFYGK